MVQLLDMPVVAERQVMMVQTVQTAVDVPTLLLVDEVVAPTVVTHRQVPTSQKIQGTT